jgi:hypothetical protein
MNSFGDKKKKERKARANFEFIFRLNREAFQEGR